MLLMPAQIEIYEQMCALSNRMVEAARAHDWEQLIDLERAVADLRETLTQDAERAPVDAHESAKKRALIQRILQDDAEVRRHTEPWMEHVRHFLTGNVRKQRIDQAYGASG
jgi:flagellar protein FliT